MREFGNGAMAAGSTCAVAEAKVRGAFESAGLKPSSADISMIPKTTVKVTGKPVQQVLNLLEELEDLDDVQSVFANFDISSQEMANIA